MKRFILILLLLPFLIGSDWARRYPNDFPPFKVPTAKGDVDQILPDQTANAGKYLTTNGTNSSWVDAGGTYLKLDCSNDPLTAALDLPELYNSLGSLKLMPDVQGNIDCFADTDVDNAVDGKQLTVTRRAAEGDTTIGIFGNDDQWAHIYSNWDISIYSNAAAGVIELGRVNTNIVRLIGDTNCIGEPNGTKNVLLRQYGYITAGGLSAQKYVQWQIDDVDDYFYLTRQSTSIVGFKVIMPTSIGDGTNSTDISSTGDISLAGTAGIVLPHMMQSDSTDQAIANINNAQVVTFNTDVHSSGITRTSSSRFTITKAGSYLITFSGVCMGVAGKEIDVWLRVNDNDVANSNTVYFFKTTGIAGLVAVSFIVHFDADDYFEFWTWGDDTSNKWDAYAAGSSPTRPACPSIIITANYSGKD